MRVKQGTSATGWAHIWSVALGFRLASSWGLTRTLSPGPHSCLPLLSLRLEENGLQWGRRVAGERRKCKAHASGWRVLLLETLIGQPE